jgi:hypothetical protein
MAPSTTILKTYLYTSIRLATACRLRVEDFHRHGERSTPIINAEATSIAPSASISLPLDEVVLQYELAKRFPGQRS